MHNRIGRRAAVAGADRMAVEDVMGSVPHLLPNEGVLVPRRRVAADAMRLVNRNPNSPAVVGTLCHALQISELTERAPCMDGAMTLAAAGRGPGGSPVLGHFVRRWI
jgi:hypothetical protein